MKFKLDENIGSHGVELFRGAGHDAITIREQGLAGACDEDIFAAVIAENRVLVTLDFDFAHVLRYPPQEAAGIVVIELGGRASLPKLLDRIRVLLATLDTQPLTGRLWIIEPGRVRMHLPSDSDDAT